MEKLLTQKLDRADVRTDGQFVAAPLPELSDLPTIKVDRAALRQQSEDAAALTGMTNLKALLEELKKTTQDAREYQKREFELARDSILAIPRLAAQAAAEGKFCVSVFTFPACSSQSAPPEIAQKSANGTIALQACVLKPGGAASMIFARCKEAGLQPSIDFWHKDQGPECGFSIIIHW